MQLRFAGDRKTLRHEALGAQERPDDGFLEHALKLYVKRRKRRVERIQSASRKLGRLMFASWAPAAAARNLALRFYSLQMLSRDIARAFEAPV